MVNPWILLEWLGEADGGGAVENDVDAGGELLHILRADGQARLHQLAADGDDLPVEVGVVLPHTVEELQPHTHARTHTDWVSLRLRVNFLPLIIMNHARVAQELEGRSTAKTYSSVDS